MKKSCLIFSLIFFVLWGAYAYFLYRYLNLGIATLLGFFGAMGVVALVGGIRGTISWIRKSQAIRRALEGQPFVDGKLAVAVGPIRAEGPLLSSPVLGKGCVAYEYDVFREGAPMKNSAERTKDIVYTGVAMCLSAVQSLQGKIRMLGFPMLEHFPKEVVSIEEKGEGFFQYVKTTRFEDRLGLKKLGVISQLENLLSDVDGTVRMDLQVGKIPESWEGYKLSEKVVTNGQPVVAMGRYAADQMGLVTRLGIGGMANDLYPGTPEAVMKKIRGSTLYILIFGLIFSIFIHGILAVLVLNPPK